MSVFEKVFTESVKDVIGNDPVVDQFDIVYNSSFFGTMQDDYITGSLLSVVKFEGVTKSNSGIRGRAFSKYFANIQPSLSSDFSSRDVSIIPQLSYRQVPWHERVSRTSNRTIQCFDSKERYYDSCIPDLNYCLRANGSRVWGMNTNSSLSPYGNVDTKNNGFLIFNSVSLARTDEGFENDPTVNNEWTWSYPYETKYNPEKRLVKSSGVLGIKNIDLRADWNFELSGSSYFKNWHIKLENVKNSKLFPISGIIPILPGRLESSKINPLGGRNSLRGVFDKKSPYATKAINGIDLSLDERTGVSLLVPADVNLGKYADHSFLGSLSISDPGNELLTGSMTTDDSVKFFFGFGDLNNMTYAKYIYDPLSDEYLENFEIGEKITYYMWGQSDTAEATQNNVGYDRSLSRSKETLEYTVTRDNGPPEFRITGWHSVAYDNLSDTFWLSNNNDPNATTIPSGIWRFRINCYGSNTFLQLKAEIYKWDGTSATLLGTTDVKDVPGSMTYLTMTWTISSPISLTSTDRILVKTLVNFPVAYSEIYFKNRHTYTVITRFSSIVTNIPNTYLPNEKYTPSYELNSYNQGNLIVNWKNSPTVRPWSIVYRSGSTSIGSEEYNYWGPAPLSGTISPNKRGLFGLKNENNDFILYSSGSYDSTIQDEYSICCMDITSSNPWTIKYDRSVAGTGDHLFKSYISGYPGMPSHQLAGGAFSETEVLEEVTGSNNDPGTTPSPTNPKYYFDMFKTFDSGLQFGGSVDQPVTFPPGEWRINFILDWIGIPADEFIMAGLDNVRITLYNVTGDPNGPKIGGNNYPQFRTYRVDPRKNEVLTADALTSLNDEATKQIHQANIFGISPVIRGWKYGLFSGLPMNSKAVFRRNRYGQFRDMLEQRQYTKFINVEDSPSDDDSIVRNGFNKFTQSRLIRTITTNTIGPSVAEARFFRQRYKKDDRGIGFIYNEKVNPELTTSQNLSTEITSSLPYFDGISKIRQESDLSLIKETTLTSLQIDTTGLTVV